MHTAGLRELIHEGSSLVLGSTARVRSWRTDAGSLVGPELAGTTVELRDVTARAAEHEMPARTLLTATCGTVEVLDRLVTAAEPVGRAAPGVALARLLRCLESPLDVELHAVLGTAQRRWTCLGRIAFGYLAGRKVTVDGGEINLLPGGLSTRLRAETATWTAVTIAVDGHLPAQPAALLPPG